MGPKARVKPNATPSPGPIGNVNGLITPDTAPSPDGNSKPPIKPTESEKSWWGSWGGVVHGALDVVGLIPLVGDVADGANALIYLAEGDGVNAALSAAAMLPVGGQAATAAKWGKRGVEATQVGTKVAKAEVKAVKAETKVVKKEVKEEAVDQGARNGGKKGGKDKGRSGPCDHLKRGNADGEGPYRGGSYGGTRQRGIESHHAPANSTSPLPKSQGPAVQMNPFDHRETASHGWGGIEGARYRKTIAELVGQGKWRQAMVEEIMDIRRVARESGDPTKYNEGIKEMLEYFKCLEKHKLLPTSK